jgi:hypothetical protein
MHILDPREIRVSYVSTGVADCQLDFGYDLLDSVDQHLPGLMLKMYWDVIYRYFAFGYCCPVLYHSTPEAKSLHSCGQA